MNLETLRLYIDVVRSESFSLGAVEHSLSQSGASHAIRRLEDELGASLIDRTKRPFLVTSAGEKFFDACVELLGKLERAKEDLAAQRASSARVVRVAAIDSLATDLLLFAKLFKLKNRQVSVDLEFLSADNVIKAVLDQRVDIGIGPLPSAHRSLIHFPWRVSPMVVVCPARHKLARQKRLRAKDLISQEFISFERRSPMRRAIERSMKVHGVVLNVVMECGDIETIKHALSTQPYLSILPQRCIEEELARGVLAARRLHGLHLDEALSITRHRRRILPPIGEEFFRFIRNRKT